MGKIGNFFLKVKADFHRKTQTFYCFILVILGQNLGIGAQNSVETKEFQHVV